MRRLPVYLLLDTSGSMFGEPIEAVKNGLQNLISALNQDPYALETAYLSIITFDSSVKQVVPLTELTQIQVPNISASGGTSLGGALKLLAERVDVEVTKTTREVKGDWKPIAFIMTDGEPTDNLNEGLNKLNRSKFANIIACAVGHNANTDTLRRITESVVQLDTADQQTIKAFFQWVTASVKSKSVSVEEKGTEEGTMSELPPPPPEVNIVV